MSSLIRDTQFGQFVRLLTGKRLFKYEEELDTALCLRYADKTTNKTTMPLHSTDEKADTPSEVLASSAQSQRSDVKESQLPTPTLASIERAEVGSAADENLVDWYGPSDPANPMNWSTPKKFFVTSQICLLTVSIYSGSSIYAPAIESVAQTFGVSIVAAVLGLTLFVLGYGLGSWSYSLSNSAHPLT